MTPVVTFLPALVLAILCGCAPRVYTLARHIQAGGSAVASEVTAAPATTVPRPAALELVEPCDVPPQEHEPEPPAERRSEASRRLGWTNFRSPLVELLRRARGSGEAPIAPAHAAASPGGATAALPPIEPTVTSLVPDTAIAEIAGAVGWEPQGDRATGPDRWLRVALEEMPDETFLPLRTTHVVAWQGTRDGQAREGFYFECEDGAHTGYYDRSGKAIGFEKIPEPVPGARISSGFTSSRLHPVLRYRRAHNGVDFAAPTGTPIYAVADGEVTWSGPHDVSGKLIRIRHERMYQSHYAHLSKIAPTIIVGAHVKRGDVIGYVGSTGLAAGPHLHFAISINGRYVDPEQAMLPRDHELAGEELAEFRQLVARVDLAYSRSSPKAAGGDRIAMASKQPN